MSKHITEWLNAYLDDELHGSRLHQVKAHLAECQLCQAELGSLKQLSGLLHEVSLPEFISPERFSARVSLRLPHKQPATSRKKILELGWWMMPAGLLGAWIFIGTSFLVNDLLSAANYLGLLGSVSNWLVFDSSAGTYWSTTLGRFGILSSNGLSWAASMETFTRTALPQISLQVSIALLYLSWIVIWWAHRTRQEHAQILAG